MHAQISNMEKGPIIKDRVAIHWRIDLQAFQAYSIFI